MPDLLVLQLIRKLETTFKKGWCKVQVAWKDPEFSKDKRRVCIIKGTYPGIVDALHKIDEYKDELRLEGMSEGAIKKHIFPIKGIYFEFAGGWIIRGTNKQLTEYNEE